MADYVVSDTSLAAVADAIRAKGGTSAQLAFPAGFVSAIGEIETGGGGGNMDADLFRIAAGTVTPASDTVYINIPLTDFDFIVLGLVTTDPTEWAVYSKNEEYDGCVATWVAHRFKSYWPCNSADLNLMGSYLSANANGHTYKTNNTATYTGTSNIKIGASGFKFKAGWTYHWIVVGVRGR